MGIDGSLASTGVAIIKDVKDGEVILTAAIETNSKETLESRIYTIQQTVKGLIDKYNIKIVIIEDVFVFINARTVINLARLNGALLALCEALEAEVILYPPATHKKVTVGKGNATKEETVKEVEKLFNIQVPFLTTKTGKIKKSKGLKLQNDNIADAISLCYCYFNKDAKRL